MSTVKKAVITAAAPSQRTLALQTLVDRDGTPKSALRIIINEALSAGVEELAVIVAPGDRPAHEAAAGDPPARVRFFEQPEPLGYGHAVLCAQSFVGRAPFLLLVSDHLYLSDAPQSCARQLVETADAERCSVSAVQPTRETLLPFYGAVGGRRVANRAQLYEVDRVQEKPTPTEAEQHLVVPGLRAGHYLCFFGMHVLTPAVMDLLAEEVARPQRPAKVQLSDALSRLAARERYLAFEVAGRRHDIGARYGLLQAQLALALSGEDRDEVLTHLVELLAQR